MSIPISTCLLAEAGDSEEKYRELLEAVRVNGQYGHYTLFPCQCGKHEISAETAKYLAERLERDLQSSKTGLE